MTITKHIVGRTLVWLAAVTMPLHSLPAQVCGCTANASTSVAGQSLSGCSCEHKKAMAGTSDCCHQSAVQNCCSSEKTCPVSEASSCCASKSLSKTSCHCGSNCQCARSDAPAEPVAPPAEANSPERLVASTATTASFATIYLLSSMQQHLHVRTGADALSAHDCCIALCRFTL